MITLKTCKNIEILFNFALSKEPKISVTFTLWYNTKNNWLIVILTNLKNKMLIMK